METSVRMSPADAEQSAMDLCTQTAAIVFDVTKEDAYTASTMAIVGSVPSKPKEIPVAHSAQDVASLTRGEQRVVMAQVGDLMSFINRQPVYKNPVFAHRVTFVLYRVDTYKFLYITDIDAEEGETPFLLNASGEDYLRDHTRMIFAVGLARNIFVQAHGARELYSRMHAELKHHYRGASDVGFAVNTVDPKPMIMERLLVPLRPYAAIKGYINAKPGDVVMLVHIGRSTIMWKAQAGSGKVKLNKAALTHGTKPEVDLKGPSALLEPTPLVETQCWDVTFDGVTAERNYVAITDPKRGGMKVAYGHLTPGMFLPSGQPGGRMFLDDAITTYGYVLDSKVDLPRYQDIFYPKEKCSKRYPDRYDPKLSPGPCYPRGNYGPVHTRDLGVLLELHKIWLDAVCSRDSVQETSLVMEAVIEKDNKAFLTIPLLEKKPISINGQECWGGLMMVVPTEESAKTLYGYPVKKSIAFRDAPATKTELEEVYSFELLSIAIQSFHQYTPSRLSSMECDGSEDKQSLKWLKCMLGEASFATLLTDE